MSSAWQSRLRAHGVPLALVVVAALLVFARPLARGEVFVFRDHSDYFQPLRWFTAEALRAGELPLWNPFSASGEPWLANPQTGVFYPPAWLFLVLPFAVAYMLHLFAHLLLLGGGAYALFARRAAPGAAMVGAVALMLCGPTLSLLDVSNNLATFAWIPLALWCALEGRAVAGGVVLAMAFLAGEPFFAALAAGMVVGVRWLRQRFESGGVAATLHTALVAFGLSAIQLFPFLALIANSDRSVGLAPADALRESMPPLDWLRLAVPSSAPNTAQQFIPIVYMGVAVLALALAGALRERKRRDVHAWLALLSGAIVVSAGAHLAPVAWLLDAMPLTVFRYPARLVPFGAFAIAALAVIGCDRIRGRWRWMHFVIVAVVAIDLVPRMDMLLKSAAFRTRRVPYSRAVGADAKILRIGEQPPGFRGRWIGGYLNLYEQRFDAATAAPVVSASYTAFYEDLVANPAADKVANASIAWILATRKLPFHQVNERYGIRVYRNAHALPMARFENGAGRVACAPFRLAELRCLVSGEGLFVVSQQLAPGWSVTVDGEPRAALRAHGVFRGVAVRRGEREVVWTYRSRALFFGAAMTAVTLFALLVSRFVKR